MRYRTAQLGMSLHGVLLARHGETNDNLPPLRFQGFTDTPLNDTGRAQAAELAERLAGDGIRSLFASDLIRARETAEIVGLRIGLEPTLRRPAARGLSGASGRARLFDDVKREDPERYAAWMRGGADFRFPGGESLLEQQQRVEAAVTDIHAAAALPALVVCHGGSIRVMMCLRDPRGLDAFHDFNIPNVAVVPL